MDPVADPDGGADEIVGAGQAFVQVEDLDVGVVRGTDEELESIFVWWCRGGSGLGQFFSWGVAAPRGSPVVSLELNQGDRLAELAVAGTPISTGLALAGFLAGLLAMHGHLS